MSEYPSTGVYERISDTQKNNQSNKSRIVVFLLSVFLPFGSHNYYLGYHIKAIVQTGLAILIVLFIPPLFMVIFLSIYITYMISEGLTYLFWYKMKDGYDFPLYNPNKEKIPEKKKAILLAFLLPIGSHHFYLGNIKRAYLEWGFVGIILTTNIIFMIIPILYINLISIMIVIVIAWIEGLWMLIKGKKL